MSQEKLSQNYDEDPFHRRVLCFIEFATVTQNGDSGWHRTCFPIDINPFIIHPAHERLYHTTRVYAPYSLQTAVRVLLRPTRIRTVIELWDGAYGFSSLAEKTRISNLRQHILLSYFKTLSANRAAAVVVSFDSVFSFSFIFCGSSERRNKQSSSSNIWWIEV